MKILKIIVISIFLCATVGCESTTNNLDNTKVFNVKEEAKNTKVRNDNEVNIEISEEEAINLVKKYYVSNGGICDSKVVEIDRIEGENYIVHIYEIVGKGEEYEHAATLGWYKVNKYTGSVSDNNY